MPDELLSIKDLAALAQLPIATIYQLNSKGTGPRRIRLGKHVRYRRADVDRWLDQNTIAPRGGDAA